MEVAYSKVGYKPELSFGSHMFQHLVEAHTFYIACMENSHTIQFNKEILKECKDISSQFIDAELKKILSVYRCENMILAYDPFKRKVISGIKK